jgi:hypothetical protein
MGVYLFREELYGDGIREKIAHFLEATNENDFKLIVADISSKLQGLQDQDGDPRKSAVQAAERR